MNARRPTLSPYRRELHDVPLYVTTDRESWLTRIWHIVTGGY